MPFPWGPWQKLSAVSTRPELRGLLQTHSCQACSAGAAGKQVYDNAARKEILAEAQRMYQEAGADEAAEGSNAAFAKK